MPDRDDLLDAIVDVDERYGYPNDPEETPHA